MVRFVALTNGMTGHHEIGGIELARRRRDEANAGACLSVGYGVRVSRERMSACVAAVWAKFDSRSGS